ncbi:UDP-3-O-(3-hydroxymyristoyl)glucosamine N-acyltransferase [Endozoicomonas montiporae]|uniref:UDP-3-O-acylglucosamine N-acyltransferase n=1 Tax=Endozoicomonas montiporae CL-33 TaxID=570277 RepID=A0A142BBM6_9GAMM|nr:UDP-3-O-(3-hydroxymyristoyl)glucosamine N-acyltransferase [Endozoicomonas montiporae]AMO56152.1 UDP-3-O-(3-hydroxymyristoyl) glucosamine N-acyltransferase [Endozoicomonas montiporae CL-33]
MKQSYSYTLAELTDRLGASLKGDAGKVITGLNTLQEANESELAFLANPAYARYLQTSQAAAVILSPESAEGYSGNALILANPYLGYAEVSHLFDTDKGLPAGIAESAVVSSDAEVHETAAIGENAVVESGVVIEAGARIDAGAVIGHDSVISKDAHICRNVTICHGVFIGQRTIIHANAVIGADGFGNAHADGRWHKIAQIGGVVIGDDVEIGSCTCIDRGALGDTIIKNGARLDNLIQIAHNVVIGENTAVAANVGISGSTVVGKNCTIAGAAGLAGHITIADNVHLGGMAMVTKSVNKPGAYASGTGLMEAGEWRRNAVRFRKLDDMARRIRVLDKR